MWRCVSVCVRADLFRNRGSAVQRALPRTVNLLVFQQELPISKDRAAMVAAEAARIRMPVHVAVTNTCLIRTDAPLTLVAILSVFLLVAVETVRLAFDGRVLMPCQRRVAQPAAEVIRVPGRSFSARILRCEYQLVTGFTARNVHLLGVVAPAEDVAVREEIHQFRKNFVANGTGKAIRMPAFVASGPLGENGNLASTDGMCAVLTEPYLLDLYCYFGNLDRNQRRRDFNPLLHWTDAVRMRSGRFVVIHRRGIVVETVMAMRMSRIFLQFRNQIDVCNQNLARFGTSGS